jgi:uncharacterized protein YjiS (DUF1127 family)
MTLASRTAYPFPAGKAGGSIAAVFVNLVARVSARLQRTRAENELRSLSDEQLTDIGVDRSAIEPPRPVIEIDAALTRRLMSMS